MSSRAITSDDETLNFKPQLTQKWLQQWKERKNSQACTQWNINNQITYEVILSFITFNGVLLLHCFA
ncbi:CLUMA_CG003624, isoform A [Clunio marinus]|uniref:CLUMA_CG003624, isoform A n=1 Tax=Clunio marinus TaxID=568069 RepID=A0A1J1HR73_9DIPT|nr:CLUMA_CG003624, isoform A [Clunio marinus]